MTRQIIIEIPDDKNCAVCGARLVLGQNWSESNARDRRLRCKPCYSEETKHYVRQWRAENRERYREYQREYQRTYKKGGGK